MTALLRKVVSKLTSASLLLGLLVAIPLGILTAPSANAVSCASGMSVQANLKAVPAHGNVFYIDSGVTPKVDAAYAGYKITNSSGSTMSGLWVSIEGFTGGNLGLTNPLDQYQQMDAITAGSYKTAYYLLKATGPTTTAQTHTIKVYNKRPDLVGATLQLTCTFTFTAIKETIKANANKVNTITGTLLPTTATLGGKLTVAVTSAATGKVGAGSAPDGSIIWVSPSGVSTWPTRALRLESTTITLACGGSNPDIVLTDSLIQTTANTSCFSSANGSWTASYVFRIIGTGPAALAPSPIAQISSGTQYKHSDITSLTFSNLAGGTVDLSGVAASAFSVVVTASSTLIAGGTTSTNARVEYTVTLTTTSTQSVQVDEVVDVPASGTTYVTGSSKVNGATVADPIALVSESALSPPPLHYIGPYSVVSGTPVVIKFQRDIPCSSTPTDYKSTTYAKTGDQLLGKTTTLISGLNVTTTSGASCTAVVTDSPQTISPTAQTNPATGITSSGATLNGYANAYNSASVTAVFEYSTDINLVNSLTTTSSQNVTGATTSTLTAVTGTLSANTLYYFRIKVSSPTTTTAYGVILSFKTSAIQAVPTVITSAGSSVGSTTATLNGSINPNLTDISQVKFFIGTSSADVTSETGSASAKIVQSLNDAGTGYVDLTLTGSGSTIVNFDTTGLSGSTVYYFKLQGVCSVNATYCPAGKVSGTVLQFKTGAPQVTTTDATLVTDVATTLNGSMSSSVANVKYQFYYCLSSGSCSISSLSGGSTVGTSATVANPFNSTVTHNLTGLTGNRTYYFQVQGLVSDVVVSYGEIKTFTTLEISTSSLASGSQGTAYSVGLLGAGGVGPYTWTADQLPAGLTLSTSGVISGTPTTAGTTAVVISMKDEFYGTTITKSFSLVIAATYTITYDATTNGGTAISPLTASFISGGTALTLPTPASRTGYTFNGWFTAATGGTDLGKTTYTPDQTRTIYAQWSGNNYAITYAAGTGATGTIAQQTFTYPSSITLADTSTATSFTKSGYSVVGWATSNGGSKAYDLGVSYAEAVSRTLYPVWLANTYTITYNPGTGGSGSTSGQSFVYPASVTLKSAAQASGITKTGYTITGWTTSDGGLSATNALSSSYSSAANLVLYPVWTANSYTITYNAGTGGTGSITAQSYNFPGPINLSDTSTATTITRSGYSISGWAITDGGVKAYDLGVSYSEAQSRTLYPVWEAIIYTVTYNVNTGTGTVPTEGTHTIGQTFSVGPSTGLTGPVVSGVTYLFSSWNNQSDGNGLDYDPTDTFTVGSQNVTLYAKWRSPTSKTITFVSNDHTNEADDSSATQISGVSVANTRANTFARTGYTFAGWTANRDGTGTAYSNQFAYDFSADLTVHAKWSANTYNITYSAGTGGSGSTASQSFVYPGSVTLKSVVQASGITKTGYTITGWTTSNGGLSPTNALSSSYSSATDITLYPVWTANSYTITYNAGASATGTIASQSFTYPSLITLSDTSTATTITRTGYSIVGWAITDGGSKAYDLADSYSEAQSRTLYPVWSANTYTITYDATTNGGTAISPLTAVFTVGDGGLTLPTPALRSGYNFDGWFEASAGGSALTTPYSPTQSRTLYSQWTVSSPSGKTVTFYANNGSGTTSSQTASSTTALNASPFIYSGYQFTGWAANANGTGQGFANGETYNFNNHLSLYAQWSKVTITYNYTIFYNSNGGSGLMTVQSGNSASLQLNPNQFIRSGYIFAGWAISADGGTSYVNTQNISLIGILTVTLYAVWNLKPFDYLIIFNTNGGNGNMSNQSGSASSLTLKPNTFNRSNYTFIAWNTTADSTGRTYENNQSVNLINNLSLTLFAQWSQNSYTYSVTYNTNGGSGNMNVQQGYAPSFRLSPNGFARTGYQFAGWATYPGGSGQKFTNGETVNLSSGKSLNLFAQWTAISKNFTITYYSNFGPLAPVYQTGSAMLAKIKINPFSRSGFTFIGWNTNTSGSGEKYSPFDLIVLDKDLVLNLYAEWEEKNVNKSAVVPINNVSPNTDNKVDAGKTMIEVVGMPVDSIEITPLPAPSASPSASTSSTPKPATTPSASVSPSTTPKPSTTPSPTPSESSAPTPSPTKSAEVAALTMVVTYKGPGVTNVELVGNQVQVTTNSKFSGKTEVKVTITEGIQTTKISIPVTVTPAAPQNGTYSLTQSGNTLVTWEPSENAVSTLVYLNGKLGCVTKEEKCELNGLLGSNSIITLKSRGNSGLISEPVLSSYRAYEKVIVTIINFDTAKYNLTPTAIRLLKGVVNLIKKQGFENIYVSGHTDDRLGVDNQVLSNNRARVTKEYLEFLLPGVNIRITGFASSDPLVIGEDPESLAANRRAQVSVW